MKRWFALILLLAGCQSLAPQSSTLTPTWAFTGPTVAPSPTADFTLLTPGSPDALAPGQSDPTAAALPWEAQLPPVNVGDSVILTLRDGTQLRVVMYENVSLETGQRLPGLLLIGGALDGWGSWPETLRDAGFTVMVADMAGYSSVDAFVDVIRAFSESGTVNPGLIGVIGAGVGADQSLIGCAVERLCDAAVLISPIGRETLANIMADYNPRPLLLVAGRSDLEVYDTILTIERVAEGDVTLVPLESAERGMALVASNPQLIDAIRDWFVAWLKT